MKLLRRLLMNSILLLGLCIFPPHIDGSSLRLGQRSNIVSQLPDYDIQYRYRPIILPSTVRDNVQDGHGLVLDKGSNEFYFTFNPKNSTFYTSVLIRFEEKATQPQLLGSSTFLSRGVPHGLRIEGNYLYHANNAQRVTKTNLNGDILWSTDLTDWETRYPQYWPILPTDAIAVPGTDFLLVADGYGSNYIHTFNKSNGAFMKGKSFGGFGNSTVPLRFHTPHSISLDYSSSEASPVFIVSDRFNHRLVHVTMDGTLIKIIGRNKTQTPLPCNVDNSYVDHNNGHSSTPQRMAAIPSLGDSHSSLVNGSVTILIGESTIIGKIEISKLLGHKGHQHPHDAIFLPNGDLVVCCWSGPPNPHQGPALGTISYWEREALATTAFTTDSMISLFEW